MSTTDLFNNIVPIFNGLTQLLPIVLGIWLGVALIGFVVKATNSRLFGREDVTTLLKRKLHEADPNPVPNDPEPVAEKSKRKVSGISDDGEFVYEQPDDQRWARRIE